MLAYRFNKYYNLTDDIPLNSTKYFSLRETINIEDVKEQMNKNKYALFRLDYVDDMVLYYIIIEDNSNIRASAHVMSQLKKLQNAYDMSDEHCDYYIKPILLNLILDRNFL
jgi:hypothetical protein